MNILMAYLVSFSHAKEVWVNSYVKTDGTYVSGHYRTIADNTTISFGSAIFSELDSRPTDKGELQKGFLPNGDPFVSFIWTETGEWYGTKGAFYRFKAFCDSNGEEFSSSYWLALTADGDGWSDWYLMANKAWIGGGVRDSFSFDDATIKVAEYPNVTKRIGMHEIKTYVTVPVANGDTKAVTVKSSEFKSDLVSQYYYACKSIKQ